MTAVTILACTRTSTCLGWTYLRWAHSLSIIASFSIVSPIRWYTIMWLTKLRLINLLIIMNSDLLQLCLKQVDPISVTSVESIFSELLHLAIGHLLGFFDLLGIELDLTWVDGSCCSSINISIWFKIVWIHVAIVIRVSLLLLSFLWLASSCSSVLLSNSTF